MAKGELRVQRVCSEYADGVVGLFQRCDAPCHCQYFQFTGDNRDWQMRCGATPEDNARALRQELNEDRLNAFVALLDSKVVGWMRLEKPELLSKRYQGRLYRNLPCFNGERTSVLSVVCFLVDPEHREFGIARRLLQEGIAWAERSDVDALEAFPRGADDVTPEEHWTGPPALFESQGFRKVHDFQPYPVFRRDFDTGV